MPTWFITGCSTGLGRALAEAVLDAGTTPSSPRARRHGRAPGRAHPDTALAARAGRHRRRQVAAAVAAAEARFGRIDVLVNNAGYGYRAAVEEGDDADVQRLFATNFFGAVALIKAVLPGMRARRGGAIVNISSIGAPAPPGRLRLLLGDQGRARGAVRIAAQGTRAAWHHGHRGRARRVPHRLRRPVAGPVGDRDRRLRRDRRASGARRTTPRTAPSTATPPRRRRRSSPPSSRPTPPALLLLGPDALTPTGRSPRPPGRGQGVGEAQRLHQLRGLRTPFEDIFMSAELPPGRCRTLEVRLAQGRSGRGPGIRRRDAALSMGRFRRRDGMSDPLVTLSVAPYRRRARPGDRRTH